MCRGLQAKDEFKRLYAVFGARCHGVRQPTFLEQRLHLHVVGLPAAGHSSRTQQQDVWVKSAVGLGRAAAEGL